MLNPELQKLFERALAFTLQWEGGFVHNLKDPGGRTNLGITQATYDLWRKFQRLPPADVKDIKREEAEKIYLERYWFPSRAAYLPWPLCLAVFDTAVNFGVGRSAQFLNQALGFGFTRSWTTASSEAVHAADPVRTARAIAAERMSFRNRKVAERPVLRTFLKGWLNRDRALAREIDKA